MTAHKHLKQLVRARMKKTGESYSTARRQLLRDRAADPSRSQMPWHFAGSVPAATALRVLLAHAGVRAPHTGEPFSEAMLFGIAGGIGIGIFSFFYEKENFASFFVAGRHLWHDSFAYLRHACARLDINPIVRETAGAKGAEQHLRAALDEYGPCVAWVDAAHLTHRAMPAIASGNAYHIITVHALDEGAGTALIGDRTDEPIAIALTDLARARGQIKKDKHRLLSIPAAASPTSLNDLSKLVHGGLRACHDGLAGAGGVKSAATNFSLKALELWADRLHGSKDHERWERVFARGPRLWQALTGVFDYIEHHGTGGGLCRPIFAEFLAEAADALGDRRLDELAERYRDLGAAWSALADAALPDAVPICRETKELLARKAELINSGGSPDDIRMAYARLDELRPGSPDDFPLTEAQCEELRADLQRRVRSLHETETATREALGAV
jgi:Domain of unknown function (DUF4872)/Butirosin biosynthesis protein H, N-terminal